jgi:hypothetical protein
MKSYTRVLFMDIDGVLNSQRTVEATGSYPHSLETSQLGLFDWIAIGMLRKLCEQEEVGIVLSSSWRHGQKPGDFVKAFDLPVFAFTPDLMDCRGIEIQQWLDNHPEVEHWAIVDDNSDMLVSQAVHFVQTYENDGLTYENVVMLRHILQGKLGGHHHHVLLWEDELVCN